MLLTQPYLLAYQLSLFAGMALEASLGLHKLILRILSSPIVIKNFTDTGGPEQQQVLAQHRKRKAFISW
jgi:hypothetical protein